MDNREADLRALETLLFDLKSSREIEKQIIAKQKSVEDYKEKAKNRNMPKAPTKDSHISQKMERDKKKKDDKSGVLALFSMLICIAIGVISYCTSNTPSWWKSILIVVCFWLFNCFAPVGWVIGTGLSVWIGWSIWPGMSLVWQMVLVVLCIANLVVAWVGNSKDKKIKAEAEKIEAQKQAEEREYQAALREYERAIAKVKADNVAKALTTQKPALEEIKELKETLRQTNKRIADNSILVTEDKTIEVVEYVHSQIYRKRADSLVEALRMYDGEKEREKQQQQRLVNMRLKYELERNERDRKAWAELEAANRQFDFEMTMKQEQKRQTEELERIRKALEE
jgi:hypothetical protein